MTMTRASGYRQPRGWANTKARVLERDAGVCHVCGNHGADQVDHVIPVSQGGSHDDANLAAIHSWPCHSSKTAREARASTKRYTATVKRPAQPHPGLVDRHPRGSVPPRVLALREVNDRQAERTSPASFRPSLAVTR
ncbi:MAG: HNH endonuclease signature motif containing protein [Candidatus Nanopelagicales bacterium]